MEDSIIERMEDKTENKIEGRTHAGIEGNTDIPEKNTQEEIEKTDKDMQDTAALEAILFAMGEPVETARLAEALERTEKETVVLLEALRDRCGAAESGIQLLCLEGAWQMATKKEYYGQLIRVARQPKKPNLTDVMMETLSIIAYKQPVTRSEIEKIRGVSCEHAVNRLMEYELICELGRLQVPGRPILLGTTDKFLRCFGLDSKEDLPVLSPVELEDFKAEAEAELQIAVDV